MKNVREDIVLIAQAESAMSYNSSAKVFRWASRSEIVPRVWLKEKKHFRYFGGKESK